jgi:hypothetical protein
VLSVAGCASIGPAVVPQDRVGYVSSIADSWKEQTLLNVVRLRYGDAPTFLDIASVVNSYAIQGQLSAGGVINSNLTNLAPWSTATLGAGLSYQDRPTISFAPLTGDKFTRSLLRPIPPVRIFQLVQAGYPADFVLQVTVRALNGISIRRSVGDEGQGADPEFYPLLEALRRLQLDETVSLRLEKRGTEDVGVLVLASSRTPQVNQDLKFVTDTLHLKLERMAKSRSFLPPFKATTKNWPCCPVRCSRFSSSWRLVSTYQRSMLQESAPCRPNGWPTRKIRETDRWYGSCRDRLHRGPLPKHLVLDR